MDYRGVLLIGAVLGSGAIASMTACGGPDPGAITFQERPSSGGALDTSSSGSTSSTGGTTDGGGADAGPLNAVFGNSVMKWEDPGITANNANAAHNATVEGKNCAEQVTCHGGPPKQWVFAGTVYSAAAGGTTVAKAEVRVVGPDLKEIGHAYTDANGNFWFDKAATTLPAGAKVGVRKEGGGAPRLMELGLQPADSGCSANKANCHGTATTGKIYIQ